MPFYSTEFVFCFFPIVFGLFLLFNKRQPKIAVLVLLLASLVFCGYAGSIAILTLISSIFMNFLLSTAIRKIPHWKKALTITGVLANVLLLFSFKFLLPLLQTGPNNTSSENLFLNSSVPLGLSFYTLYQISYLVDTYKNVVKPLPFLQYSLSVSLFANLPAGPVMLNKSFSSQFRSLGHRTLKSTDIARGISLITFGIIKKMLLVAPLSGFTSQLFNWIIKGAKPNFIDSALAIWCFLLQLYFDFSAYSDVAIGLGLCFGLYFPANFNSPLKAISITDYINRWHISLIAFTREYILIPVSNVVRKRLKGPAARRHLLSWIAGINASYIAIGFWHSPTLSFFIYAIIQAGILTASQLINLKLSAQTVKNAVSGTKTPSISRFFNRLLVLSLAGTIGAAIQVPDFSTFQRLLNGLFRFQDLSFLNSATIFSILTLTTGNAEFLPALKEPVYYLFAQSAVIPFFWLVVSCSVLALSGPNTMEIFNIIPSSISGNTYHFPKWRPTLKWGIFIALLLFLFLYASTSINGQQDFLYE